MPNLIVLFGPPAVGKAAVGHELAALTGYRFFHNHLTADAVAALFGWGGETFGRMVKAIRETLLTEAASDASIPGVIFTYVWDLRSDDETATMLHYAQLFERHGGRVTFVELLASLETRIAREGSAFRVTLKPAHRDAEAARGRQIEMAEKYRMNCDGALPLSYPHLKFDTETQEPNAVAIAVARALTLGQDGGKT